MTAHANTASIEALLRKMQQLPGRWLLNVVFADTESASKARFLKASGRDFFASTPQLQREVTGAIAGYVRETLARNPEALDPRRAYEVGADAARRHFVGRFERQGGDVRLAPLNPLYRAWKGRDPLRDTRIGIALGTLYRDLKVRARVLVRRIA